MHRIDYMWVSCMSAFKETAYLAIKTLEQVTAPAFTEIIVSNYTAHDLSVKSGHTSVVSCHNDWGSGSKLLCCLNHLQHYNLNRTFITLVDDDVAYRPYLLKEVQKSVSVNSAISYYGYHVGKLLVLQGVDALTTLATHWNGIHVWVDDLMRNFPWLRYHDDLWLSLWLKMKGVTSRVVHRPHGRLVHTSLCRKYCRGLFDKKENLSRAHLNSLFQSAMSKRFVGLV